jgi:hypothetical protein
MNIKLLIMFMCAIVFSGVGFASSSGSPSSSSVNKRLFPATPAGGGAKDKPSAEIDVSALDRPKPDHDLVEETYREDGKDETRMMTDPAKYGKGIHTNHYVYQARNDVIDVLQKNITPLERQAIASAIELEALQEEDAEYFRAVEIKKQALKEALLK